MQSGSQQVTGLAQCVWASMPGRFTFVQTAAVGSQSSTGGTGARSIVGLGTAEVPQFA